MERIARYVESSGKTCRRFSRGSDFSDNVVGEFGGWTGNSVDVLIFANSAPDMFPCLASQNTVNGTGARGETTAQFGEGLVGISDFDDLLFGEFGMNGFRAAPNEMSAVMESVGDVLGLSARLKMLDVAATAIAANFVTNDMIDWNSTLVVNPDESVDHPMKSANHERPVTVRGESSLPYDAAIGREFSGILNSFEERGSSI